MMNKGWARKRPFKKRNKRPFNLPLDVDQHLIGTRFGSLVLIRAERRKYISVKGSAVIGYYCQCDCGVKKWFRKSNIIDASSPSCGCQQFKVRNKTHGMSSSKMYSKWNSMKRRCYDPKSDYYYLYGARGISVCDRWHSFENFYTDMGLPPTKNHSLDRIDNNKGYFPENCRWASREEQANNTRSNRFLTFDGKTMTVRQWERHCKFPDDLIKARLQRGWTVERCILTPLSIKISMGKKRSNKKREHKN